MTCILRSLSNHGATVGDVEARGIATMVFAIMPVCNLTAPALRLTVWPYRSRFYDMVSGAKQPFDFRLWRNGSFLAEYQ